MIKMSLEHARQVLDNVEGAYTMGTYEYLEPHIVSVEPLVVANEGSAMFANYKILVLEDGVYVATEDSHLLDRISNFLAQLLSEEEGD